VTLSPAEHELFRRRLARIDGRASVSEVVDKTIHHDAFEVARHLPAGFVDLLFVDPPYNLSKRFNSTSFKKTDSHAYGAWLGRFFDAIAHVLAPRASVYVCCEWASSPAVHSVLSERFIVRNRITWEREKGRGARDNWKSASEDIWFCTVADDYVFNLNAVKLKRRVVAPYTGASGEPKDWARTSAGDFRLTHPSNLWTDITVPFWSMPENTDHPTQKPEKLLAKIVLASSRAGDVVLDPFLGSGTTSVVARKLGRRYVGVEIDEAYCCLAEKRLELADRGDAIQGYADGVFWERNALSATRRRRIEPVGSGGGAT
jgi:site-specific DNA-methyltransferase (adenine-specific)